MKIGVLTLPLNKNYGGNLQAYALMETLKRLGHEPVLIYRRHPPKAPRESVAGSVGGAERPLMSTSVPMSKSVANRSFIKKYISPRSRAYYSASDLRENISRYSFDAVIVGSDQVWRPRFAKSLLLDFFLGFLPEGDSRIKRISYAASFGTSHWQYNPGQAREAAGLLSRFDAVSVREDGAVELCRQHLGVNAKHVLDPTLLVDRAQYEKIAAPKVDKSRQRRLTTYILDISEDKAGLIGAIAERLSLTARSTDGQIFGSGTSSEARAPDMSVEAWLAAFIEADFIVTDSFHGAVFSILFNKPFVAYGNPDRGMARFTSLLKMFGLEDRIVINHSGAGIDHLLRPIDWDMVNNRLEKLREGSLQFLSSALSGDGEASGPPSAVHLQTPDAPSRNLPSTDAVNPSIQAHPLSVLCSGCGVCVSESQGSLAMAWSVDGFLAPKAQAGAVPAGAVKVCPFNPHPEKEVEDEDALANLFLADAKRFDPRAGRYENSYIGYSKAFRPTSSSGGIATYVLAKALERGEVDLLYIVQRDERGGYKYQVFDAEDDIKSISKTRYFPVSLDDLFNIIEKTDGRVAISAVPCFVKAVRLKQHYHPRLKEKIPLIVGIICGGLKSRLYTDFLAQSAGISGPYAEPEYRVKNPKGGALDYSFSALNDLSERRSVRMKRVGDMWGTGLFKASACDFCTDVLAELADISLGDAWLPKYKLDGLGNSVIVTRSALAERLIRSGAEQGDLVVEQVPVAQVVQSQRGGLNHRQDAIKFRLWVAKYILGLPVPVVRARLLNSLSISNVIVQIARGRTRAKSLKSWTRTKDVGEFNRRMRAPLSRLRDVTADRQNNSNDPLYDLLLTKNFDAADWLGVGAAGARPIVRWLTRKIRGQQFSFDMLRAALLEANVICPPERNAEAQQVKAEAGGDQ